MKLSPRETQVMHFAALGLTAKATANELGITPAAVNLYILLARRKLQAKNKAEAVAKWTASTENQVEDAKP